MRPLITVFLLLCALPMLEAREHRYPEHGLSFSLPGEEHWEELIHMVGDDFLALSYRSRESHRIAMFVAFPDQGMTLEESAKQFMDGFLRVSGPVVSKPKAAFMDGNDALRYQVEYRDEVNRRKALLVVSSKDGMAYAVLLSPSRGEPLADGLLRAIGASLRIFQRSVPDGRD